MEPRVYYYNKYSKRYAKPRQLKNVVTRSGHEVLKVE